MNFHAWKFVWIVQINYKSSKVQKVQKKVQKVHKYKSTHNSVIFRATDSRFCMEVRMDCPDKLRKINFVITYIRNYVFTYIRKKNYVYKKKKNLKKELKVWTPLL